MKRMRRMRRIKDGKIVAGMNPRGIKTICIEAHALPVFAGAYLGCPVVCFADLQASYYGVIIMNNKFIFIIIIIIIIIIIVVVIIVDVIIIITTTTTIIIVVTNVCQR